MADNALEGWLRQIRRTEEYKARAALLEERAALAKRLAEIDAELRSGGTDAAFVSQTDDRARRVAQFLAYCKAQQASAKARCARSGASSEGRKW